MTFRLLGSTMAGMLSSTARRSLATKSLSRMAASSRFASTSAGEVRVNAITYRENSKSPADVLEASTFTLPPPKPDEVRIRYRLSPLNPADFNVLQGTYPYKPSLRHGLLPEPFFVGGNEGLAEVERVGSEAQTDLKPGDWVVMAAPQLGTWQSHSNLPPSSLSHVPRSASSSSQLSPLAAATLMVNPSTAYRLLRDFVELEAGEWVVQNGANSAVGQAVVQIARGMGVKTINLVRDRPDFDRLKAHLESLGADEVATYDQLSSRPFVKFLLSRLASPPRLALNCVSGPPTQAMVGALLKGDDARLVSYGAMSLQPLSLPTSAFIFRNLTASGFNMTRWYEQQQQSGKGDRRGEMVRVLVGMYERGS